MMPHPHAHRETTAPTRIGPYKVPEGIVVWPMIYGLQNSTHNWDNPHLFQPVSMPWRGPDREGGGWVGHDGCCCASAGTGNRYMLPCCSCWCWVLITSSFSTAATPFPRPLPPPAPQERWLDPGTAYLPGTVEEGSGKGVRRFLPFSDGLKSCLGQVSGWKDGGGLTGSEGLGQLKVGEWA
jgi:hypothetical protein